MVILKVLVVALVATFALAVEDAESGLYSAELYEKPYEQPEVTEATTDEPVEVETPDPPESETTEVPEAAETPEGATPEVAETPEAPEAPEAPVEVVAANPPFAADNLLPAPLAAFPLPYPLVHAYPGAAPFVYSDPQYLRIASGFPSVVVV